MEKRSDGGSPKCFSVNPWMIELEYILSGENFTYISRNVFSPDFDWANLKIDYISRMRLHIPKGKILLVSGMKEYNIFFETLQSFCRGSEFKIETLYICSRFWDSPTSVVWSFRKGKLTRKQTVAGKEWNGQEVPGWKSGNKIHREISDLIEGVPQE